MMERVSLQSRIAFSLILAALLPAGEATAQSVEWSGFALLRANNTHSTGPLAADRTSAQVQLGVDWRPSILLGVHVHMIARDNDEHRGKRDKIGVTEAYVEANAKRKNDRLRIRAGAMFLPTSRENIDELWQSPYNMMPSALNSWFGEEFRPIGIDATWMHRGVMLGATIFRGNDTFGALPPARGWAIRDHWILLGEHVAVDDEYYTSVSAENDHHAGWSARAGWSSQNVVLQATHIDNRSDALNYGELFNWDTQFDLLGGQYNSDDWTVAGEYGWGPTAIIVFGNRYTSKLRAGYLLASRRFAHSRATIRVESFDDGNVHKDRAITASWLLNLKQLRPAIEFTRTRHDSRALVELRYSFSAR